MRSPAVNLFNTSSGGVTATITATTTGSKTNHNSTLNYGTCQWYMTACPDFGTGTTPTSWRASNVVVNHSYYTRTGSGSKFIYTQHTDQVASYNIPLDNLTWSQRVSTSITTQSWYTTQLLTTQYPDSLVITFTDAAGDTVTLNIILPSGATVRRQFNFLIGGASWGTSAIYRFPFITQLVITQGATNYTWSDIYPPIATNEELLDDFGVVYDNITDEQRTPNYAKKTIKYGSYYFEDGDEGYHMYGDYIQYRYDGDGYSIMFPVNSHTSQSYTTNQAIRYADINFSRAFIDPSGSW